MLFHIIINRRCYYFTLGQDYLVGEGKVNTHALKREPKSRSLRVTGFGSYEVFRSNFFAFL